MSTPSLQLKYPVVLIHGLGARCMYGPFEYFHGLAKMLRDAGNEVYIANLTPWQTIEHRAKQLKIQIENHFPEGKVNLIGHSMGGLDARYLVSQLCFAERVASVTTIGTPHQGTTIGDLALGLLPDGALSWVDKLMKNLDSSVGAFQQITRQYMRETFAQQCPKAKDVAFFSATSAIVDPFMKTSLPMFWLPYHVLKKHEGDNDGFVSVESAKYGEHICTYAGDHYGQIGQFLGRSRGLNYVKFYEEILGRLKAEAF